MRRKHFRVTTKYAAPSQAGHLSNAKVKSRRDKIGSLTCTGWMISFAKERCVTLNTPPVFGQSRPLDVGDDDEQFPYRMRSSLRISHRYRCSVNFPVSRHLCERKAVGKDDAFHVIEIVASQVAPSLKYIVPTLAAKRSHCT